MTFATKEQAWSDALHREHDDEDERAEARALFVEGTAEGIEHVTAKALATGHKITSRLTGHPVTVAEELTLWDASIDPPMQWAMWMYEGKVDTARVIEAYALHYAVIECEKFEEAGR